jgi:hypothetical protein
MAHVSQFYGVGFAFRHSEFCGGPGDQNVFDQDVIGYGKPTALNSNLFGVHAETPMLFLVIYSV